MSANPLDIRLRGHDDLLIAFEKRIESLETTRAFHADTLTRLANRVDALSEAFRARTDELAGLLEFLEQSAMKTDSRMLSLESTRSVHAAAIYSLEQSRDQKYAEMVAVIVALRSEINSLLSAITLQDTAIESLDAQYKRIAISQDNDRASVIQQHIEYTQKIIDIREVVATQLETTHKRLDAQRNAPGWIHYVDAGDLHKIIDARVRQAFTDAGRPPIISKPNSPF